MSAYSRGMTSLETKIIHDSMAAVGIGFNELKDMLVDGVEITCHKSADSSTISRPADVISDYIKMLKSKKEVLCSNIQTSKEMGTKYLCRLKEVIKVPRERTSKWISSSKWNNPESLFSSAKYHTNNLFQYCFIPGTPFKKCTHHRIAPHGLLQPLLKRLLPDGLHVGVAERARTKKIRFSSWTHWENF